MAIGHRSLTDFSPSWKLLCFTVWSKSEHVLKENSLTGVLFWFLAWTLALRFALLLKKKKAQNVNSFKTLRSWSTVRTSYCYRQTHYSLWLVPSLRKTLKNIMTARWFFLMCGSCRLLVKPSILDCFKEFRMCLDGDTFINGKFFKMAYEA